MSSLAKVKIVSSPPKSNARKASKVKPPVGLPVGYVGDNSNVDETKPLKQKAPPKTKATTTITKSKAKPKTKVNFNVDEEAEAAEEVEE